MKTYRTLLFDIDDTLLDFGVEEDVALRRLFDGKPLALTPEVKASFQRINHSLWTLFEEGQIDREELLPARHAKLWEEYGHVVDGTVLEAEYRSHLEQGFALIDGALDLVAALANHFELYLVTNGVSSIQYARLRNAGLHPLFKGVFVSEDTGFRKPMKEYFDFVFSSIPDFKREEALIIGDSLTADIRGGQQAGIDTCWFNPHGKPNASGLTPTYTIRSLREVYDIVGRQFEPTPA